MKHAYFILILMALSLDGCSTSREYYAPPPKKTPPMAPANTPPPPPPPPKKETETECKLMNGEGRTFKARGATRYEAENKARRDCEVSYRRCTVLKCEVKFTDE